MIPVIKIKWIISALYLVIKLEFEHQKKEKKFYKPKANILYHDSWSTSETWKLPSGAGAFGRTFQNLSMTDRCRREQTDASTTFQHLNYEKSKPKISTTVEFEERRINTSLFSHSFPGCLL